MWCFWVPLLFLLEKTDSAKKSFWYAWLAMVLMLSSAFYWIAYTAHEFGFMPWPLASLVLVAFVGGMYFYQAIAALAFWWFRHRLRMSLSISLAAYVLTLSVAEAFWPGLFRWNWGYVFYWGNFPIAQFADVVGFWGLSLLVHSSSAWVFYLWRSSLARKTKWTLASLSVIAFALLNAWGAQRKKHYASEEQVLRVLQVQGNISNADRRNAENNKGSDLQIAEKYFQLTRQGLELAKNQHKPIDLIVWPEAAYPDFLNEELAPRPMAEKLREFVRSTQVPLLTGAYAVEFQGQKQLIYNSLFLLNERAQVLGKPYHKTKLLAFGDYTPFADVIPWLGKISPAGVGFNAGNGPKTLPFRNWVLGAQICYEGLDADFNALSVRLGAQVLVNLTNDSWFGDTAEPRQHEILSLGRAIETRRPFIRSTNTGITTVALADGTRLEESPLLEEWFHIFEIPLPKEYKITWFVSTGRHLPWLALASLLILLVIGWRRAKHRLA